MNSLTERFRTHVRAHPKREDPLAPFRRLIDPVPGEDDVARYARVCGAKKLGLRLTREDFEHLRKIDQLTNHERARARCLGRIRSAPKLLAARRLTIPVFNFCPK